MGKTLPNGASRFLSATLRLTIELLAGTDVGAADSLHREVHKYCFIAQSVNFPVAYETSYVSSKASAGA